jgi:lipopolysaccharide assembly protein A
MRFALILSLLIGIIAVIFAIYNPEETTVNLITHRITSPLALVIIVTLLAGVLAGILASVPSVVRRGQEVRYLRKRVNELEGDRTTVTDRPVATTSADDRRTRGAETAGGAAETERLAAESERMANEARLRAAELERQEAERRRENP